MSRRTLLNPRVGTQDLPSVYTKAETDAEFVTATVTGDPSDPDVTLYLNGVEL